MIEQTAYRTHTCGSLRKEHAGKTVTLAGWVHARRDHRSVLFVDLRDRYGLTQVVVSKETIRVPPHNASRSEAGRPDDLELHDEDVVQIEGTVAERPLKLVNPNIATGEVELQAKRVTRLSAAKNPPFEITKDTDVNEDIRLAYRYLDLRRARLQRNILLRHTVTTLVRDYLNKEGFIEIETPLLTKTSPEGARDYLVPSRLHPGKFYALPQSPQQFKQLLMLAGFDRYYQIARALRDEDSRGDRQPEHTQIDLEMSFVREEEVRALVESMYIHVVEACGKKIWKKPFPVFTHEEAIRQFGADKFDLREGEEKNTPDVFAFAWVVDFPLFEWEEEKKRFTFAHNPFSAPQEEHVEKLMRGEDLGSLRAQQYDLVCNGYELASGGVRISDPTVQRKIFEIMGLTAEQTEERFGHLLRAYEYGAPPHAGMAPGLDRLIMLLAGEPNIREVIAFPKNQKAEDVLFNAPSDVDPGQLKELHIRTDLPKSS